MTFGEYLVDIYARHVPGVQRQGQFAFNRLHQVRPELANEIRGTSVDPFYQDELLDAFLQYVGERW